MIHWETYANRLHAAYPGVFATIDLKPLIEDIIQDCKGKEQSMSETPTPRTDAIMALITPHPDRPYVKAEVAKLEREKGRGV